MALLPPKDPNEVLNYTFNFASELASGEAISSVSITVTDGLVVDASSNTSSTVTARISGGTVGSTGKVTCQATTDASQVIIDTALIPIHSK